MTLIKIVHASNDKVNFLTWYMCGMRVLNRSIVIFIYTSTIFAMKNIHMCNLHILGDLLLYLTHAKIQ